MARRRRIAAVTGSRADYGHLRPVLAALARRGGVDLHVVVTGMHLQAAYGATAREVERDGWAIREVPVAAAADSLPAVARSIGAGVVAMVDAFEALDPDIVVVLGDRFEVLAAALAATYSGRLLAHIHGGDRSQGGYDEYTRHAVTKLAHLHFAATRTSAARIRRLGEDPARIVTVGAPGLDDLVAGIPYGADICTRHGVKPGGYLLVAFHPVSTDPGQAGREMRAVLHGAADAGLPVIGIFPNSDPGTRATLAELRQARHVKTHPSLPRKEYLGLLANCAALVGNSSSGIIEAPVLGIPAVNVGPRQEGRERGANVLDVRADRKAVRNAIGKALNDPAFRKRVARRRHPYGDGKAGARIAAKLATVGLNAALRRKTFHD